MASAIWGRFEPVWNHELMTSDDRVLNYRTSLSIWYSIDMSVAYMSVITAQANYAKSGKGKKIKIYI